MIVCYYYRVKISLSSTCVPHEHFHRARISSAGCVQDILAVCLSEDEWHRRFTT